MPDRSPVLSRRHLVKALGATMGVYVSRVRSQERADTAPSATPTISVDPNSPRATLLGFVTDHQQADQVRWQKKRDDVDGKQQCQFCALFNPTDANGGTCAIFDDRQVPAAGWCHAWTGS